MSKLSISNIAWALENDGAVYGLMRKFGYTGLEIAPTRIFPENPYGKITDARKWSETLNNEYGFCIPSMQSIWYGRGEKIFGTDEERHVLSMYTKQAIDFAAAIGCRNLVFGCPRNRILPDGCDSEVAVLFFRELGDYAYEHGTVIGMEANPPIYNTNYINDTASALKLIERVNSEGFRLNLDIGTMIQNNESTEVIEGRVRFINHVHVSEPGLKPIAEHSLHDRIKTVLNKEDYDGYVSIEMGTVEDIEIIENAMSYVREIFA